MKLLRALCGMLIPVALQAQRPPLAMGMAADQNAIRAARVAQNQAIAAGDVNTVARYWTEDVTIRRGLGPAAAGRDAYRELFVRTGPADSALVYQRQTADVEVSEHWPLAFETGTWVGHVGTASGPAAIRGRYSAQWVKRDGHWLIRSEVFVALTCAGAGCGATAEP